MISKWLQMMKKLQAGPRAKVPRSSLGKQCAAYNCTSRLYNIEDGERKLTGINFFRFLKDQGEKQAWCNLIKRRNSMDGFKVTATTILCDKHFERDKLYRPAGGTKVRLLKDSRPVLHEWNGFENKRKLTERKPPKIRCQTNSTDTCERLSTGPKYSKKLCKSLGLSFDTCVAVDTTPVSKENISTTPQNTTSNIGPPSSQDINNVRDTESSKIELEGYQCQSADSANDGNCIKLALIKSSLKRTLLHIKLSNWRKRKKF